MASIKALIEMFRPAFSTPTYDNFSYLMLAWIRCESRRCISNLLRAGRFMPGLRMKPDGEPKHFSIFYRFFSRAKWSLDELGHLLALALKARLGQTVYVLVDDTVCRRTGPFVMGAGIHRDPMRSTLTGKRVRKSAFCWGLQFVTLAVWVPVGFMHSGGIAVPLLFRLHRTRKLCPPEAYCSRPQLFAEMLAVLRSWWLEAHFVVVGDNDYVNRTVFSALDDNMEMVGRFKANAALFDAKVEQTPGPGRRRIWGKRLPSLAELAEDPQLPWKEQILYIYGQQLQLWIKTFEAQWKSAGKDRVLTVVITRDPSGRLEDNYYFRSRPGCSGPKVLIPQSLRWSLESCYRDCKQYMGIEEVQNGFAQGDEPADSTIHGPKAPIERRPIASERTVPFGMLCYSFVVLWYLDHGQPLKDIWWARYLAPWYPHKVTISFVDMLQAFHRQMEQEQLWQTRSDDRVYEKQTTQLARHAPPGADGARKAA
ncbi:transposase [Persicimonas caeni]|nr:transposase [Persicimonas caeni]QED31112.1 transposase [Persicimonas caeni]QED31607.1 transposase [Persicimonas caeni]QED31663.1 transposase [Persicimonas caeni]QED32247.1 transposase [Persicimonas caeni]QED32292.1 transposase [Persicimonas caeni]